MLALILSIFTFIFLGFAWALTDDEVKELKDRFKKQSGGEIGTYIFIGYALL